MNAVRQALAAAIFLAVLGFSFALATSQSPDGDAASAPAPRNFAAPRDVGQTLRFTNPLILAGSTSDFPTGGGATEPQGFDLGDVAVGVPMTRYLTAAGGFLPYSFITRPTFDFLGFGESVLPSVVLYGNGKIVDQPNFLFASNSNSTGIPAYFNATVTDFLGTQRTGTFRLGLVPAPSVLRFAQDRLPTAQLGQPYFTNLEVLAPPNSGQLPAKFVQIGAVIVAGKLYRRLEDAGLSLTPNGILYGRPSFERVAGSASFTISFTVRALDASGFTVAMSRDGTQIDQPFVMTVENTTQAMSEVFPIRCAIQAVTDGTSGKDSMTFSGSFDPKGETVFSLAGTPFTFRLGTNIFTGNFDAKGKVKSVSSDKKSSFEAKVNPSSGTISVKIKGASLGAGIKLADGASSPPTPTLRLGGGNSLEDVDERAVAQFGLPVVFGFEFKHYRTSDVLVLLARARGKKTSLNYQLGSKGKRVDGSTVGVSNITGYSMAGGFQVLRVSGQDRRDIAGGSGEEGDAWQVRWLGVPRFIIDDSLTAIPVRIEGGGSQTATLRTTIRIGDDFTQTVTASLVSTRLRFRGTGSSAGIYTLTLDGERFVHTMETNVISQNDTAIPQAIRSKNRTMFRFGMDIPNYSGETGRVIAPNNSAWFSQ